MADHHGHSHSGPNAHSHGPQPQQVALPPAPDPLIQAALDARVQTVPLRLEADEKGLVRVVSTDASSKWDFDSLNHLAYQMAAEFPQAGAIPLPINPQTVLQNPRSHAVVKAKDEGNKVYGQGKYAQAIQMYTTAATITMSRPDWEASNLIKEELAMVLSNRSAAHAAAGDFVSALVDADVVIQVKRPWSKGHFRKAKALQGLKNYSEAILALGLGLSFEPVNQEMLAFVAELDAQIKKEEEDKVERKAAA